MDFVDKILLEAFVFTPVKSSNIKIVGYDKNTRILQLQFHYDDAVYQYKNVSPIMYRKLLSAPSKGKFLYYKVRDKYPYQRIS